MIDIKQTSGSPRSRRRSVLAGVCISGAGLALVAAPEADAGAYRALQCHESKGARHADAAYSANSRRYASGVNCAAAGLAVTHDPGRSRTPRSRFGAWTLRRPAGTRITRAKAVVRARGADGHEPQMLIRMAAGVTSGIRGIRGARHLVGWEGSGGRALVARLICERPGGCGPGRRAHIRFGRIALTLRDSALPALAPAGSLLLPGARRGGETLTVTTHDAGSGVRTVTLELNGYPLAARAADCAIAGHVALRLRPCPTSAHEEFKLTTTSRHFRQGPNEVRVCAADFAPRGAVNRTCSAHTVRIDNLCPLSSVAGAALDARFRGAGNRVRTRSDEPTEVVGRVTSQAGAPVSGARVCVAARPLGTGVAERVIATPTTGADGTFVAQVPAGPSRAVRVAHWPSAERALERHLILTSRVVPRLRLRPNRTLTNGERVRFRVRIPGPAKSRRRVRIQARTSGGDWIQIKGGLTGSRGIWRGRYRFRSTTGTRRYAFRAVVPRQPGYPYAGGRSRVAHQRVRG